MNVKISKSARKFLDRLDDNIRANVLSKIEILKICLETQQVYPPEELDIKKLKGKLKGFSRIRVGSIRVIFQIQQEEEAITIYDINFRGSIYKQ